MCENCKDTKDTLEITANNIQGVVEGIEQSPAVFFEPPEISLDELDEDEFTKGMKDASYACGMFTALANVGFSAEDAVAYIFNKMNIEHNVKCTEINANASIESAKNMVIAKEKEML